MTTHPPKKQGRSQRRAMRRLNALVKTWEALMKDRQGHYDPAAFHRPGSMERSY